MEGIEYFKSMASELNNYEIQFWKQSGKRVMGTVCSNIPEEPLSAAGFLPMRIRAPGIGDTSNADSHLHRMICSYNRAVLESLLRKELEFLDGIVSTDTCDHMHRLTGELRDKANVPVHYFSMYHALTPVAGEWLILEMDRMIQHIETSYGIKISDEDLRRAISIHNRTRELMGRLNELRKKDPPPLTGGEYAQIVLAGMSIPREIFNEKLEAFLRAVNREKPACRG
jgi:benzoyl-CoA reductase/2-hydroxyglutaryl-CoA dehydratase subunit BcrC/BadD/HgdB